MPHWIVVMLALAVSLPVCALLAAAGLSRVRLGVAVVLSQTVLHSLFALFPAAASASTATRGDDAGHDHAVTIAAAAQSSTVTQLPPDGPMIFAHVLAAAFSFTVFRRGEVILQALGDLLLLRPIVMLFLRPASLTGPRVIRAHDSFSSVILQDLWRGGGAQTLRGPPVLVS